MKTMHKIPRNARIFTSTSGVKGQGYCFHERKGNNRSQHKTSQLVALLHPAYSLQVFKSYGFAVRNRAVSKPKNYLVHPVLYSHAQFAKARNIRNQSCVMLAILKLSHLDTVSNKFYTTTTYIFILHYAWLQHIRSKSISSLLMR